MPDVILEHFSSGPLRPPQDFEQPEPSCYGKPKGLWVSARGEHDWLEWCRAENFRLNEIFKYRTIVHLKDDAKILWVTSAHELDAFDERYSKPDADLQRGLGLNRYSSRFNGPHWLEVSKEYDGIVIAPYLWERRLSEKCSWYYTWDCSSGCIWHARAIDRFEEVDQL